MTGNLRIWPIVLLLGILSSPLIIMYVFQVIESVAQPQPGTLMPGEINFHNWRFLWQELDRGRPSIWTATINTFIFATTIALAVCALSSTAGYALSRLNLPGRPYFLGGLIILHAFPTITLIIAIFIVLQYLGLFDTLLGVILVKAALELPFGIWIMKGFYDTVPWEIEMAGVQDGASRFRVWWELVLPQVKPGLAALGIISFLQGWSEFVLPLVLAPGSETQVLATYMYSVIQDDAKLDFGLFKAIGMFYSLPVILVYLIFQKQLMNIYGGGTKG
ncbi:carbohydrate ABC transporter permease [Amaricoccus tamworthensis]|uniref:carbohydrate ABC transporter permease n=1 Tax=Amaricoccus tamworthensis TaxID=57002 RepID=UPI003C7D9B8E